MFCTWGQPGVSIMNFCLFKLKTPNTLNTQVWWCDSLLVRKLNLQLPYYTSTGFPSITPAKGNNKIF